jgi:hemerythrin-like domain-containing protein
VVTPGARRTGPRPLSSTPGGADAAETGRARIGGKIRVADPKEEQAVSRAIDDLMHEHEAILSALNILGDIDAKLNAGEPVDVGDVWAFIDFLKEFADKCHHGKEEGLLFPALVAAGMPERGGPVGVMLAEHVQGRQWIGDMEAAARPVLQPAAFSQAARGYAQLLQAHIRKENNILFPMAEQLLPAAQLDALFEAFEKHEATVIGPGRHDQLHRLLESLKARYSG